MPTGRLSPPRDPVTITLDGQPIVAERGEPVAAALVAAGKLVLARSPKFHRPRGPACLRAACDGCLARVNDAPNVMTCQVPAAEGTAVVSQNRLGPREADLLRVTDWFFPDGMNHHELFAGVPGVQSVMQVFARRVAGLGKLPLLAAPKRHAERRAGDVVVVGAGASGMAIAARLCEAGRAVEVLDDQLAPGGGTTALDPEGARPFEAIREPFARLVASGRIRLRCRTVAGGLYGRDLLVVGPDGAEILEARALVLASGAHDGALAFSGNDVPGVLSARAGGWLLARGVVVGSAIVVITPPGGGPFGAAFTRGLLGIAGRKVTHVTGEPRSVLGSSRVKGVVVRDAAGRDHTYEADAVLVDAPRSPAFELAEQAGARLAHLPHGYVVQTDGGRVSPGVYAVGELVGTALDAPALLAEAARVAAHVERAP